MNITVVEHEAQYQARLEKIFDTLNKREGGTLSYTVMKTATEFRVRFDGDRPNHLYFLSLEKDDKNDKAAELARLIRERNPYAMIVFLTSWEEIPENPFKYRVSAMDFIPKAATNLGERIADCLYYAQRQAEIGQDLIALLTRTAKVRQNI